MFEQFSETAQIWIYGFKQQLDDQQREIVDDELKTFKAGWLYHGQPVLGDYQIMENRFAILVTNDSISGCSIDSSVAVFKKLMTEHNIDALDQNLIFYRDTKGIIRSADRMTFRALLDQDKITDDTKVFNLMITTLGGLKRGDFEQDFKDSWHSKAFKKNATLTV